MTRLHIWTIVLALHRRLRPIGRRLREGTWQRPRQRPVTAITDSGRFRTIQTLRKEARIRRDAATLRLRMNAPQTRCAPSPRVSGERGGVRGAPHPHEIVGRILSPLPASRRFAGRGHERRLCARGQPRFGYARICIPIYDLRHAAMICQETSDGTSPPPIAASRRRRRGTAGAGAHGQRASLSEPAHHHGGAAAAGRRL
jgi:hypothetical protein